MAKRILTILFAATLVLSLTACGSSSNNDNANTETSEAANLLSAGNEDSSSSGTDFQKNMAQTQVSFTYPCESGEGYYFVGSNGYVYYIDKATESATILCGKPECSHDDEDCNAYAGSALTYYDGKLYYFSDIGSSWTQLYSMNLDGTDHTLVQTLDIDSAGDSYVGYAKPIIHRGMVYFLYSAVLYAVPLGAEASEAKAIFGETTEAETSGGAVISLGNEQDYTLWADGDTVYFMTNVQQTDGTWKDALFAYDMQTEEVTQVWEVPEKSEVGEWDTTAVEVNGWYVSDGYIYFYLSGGGLWRSELSSGTTEKIADVSASHGYAYFSDNCIVIAESAAEDYVLWKSLLVYDYSGELRNEIPLDSFEDTYSEEDLFISDGCLYFFWNGSVTSGTENGIGFSSPTSYALYAASLASDELTNLHWTDVYYDSIGWTAAE
ncbi:MAG: DUF5050 domain-containing protein [Clostridiales bacterium]|nr:DUF5050 domain-containing protein [Clostridiales bacterium]